MAATGCSREEAPRLIEAAGGSVKLAVVMRRAEVITVWKKPAKPLSRANSRSAATTSLTESTEANCTGITCTPTPGWSGRRFGVTTTFFRSGGAFFVRTPAH